MSSTDYLNLNEHKIFKCVRETLPKQIKRTQNVLAVKDNVLYTWDFQDNCVLTLNVKAARSKDGDNVTHQSLLPTSPPLFTPELLRVNGSSTLLAVAGPGGVLVFELPSRCPPHGSFDNNKDIVYCKSYSLDERLLFCGKVEIRQVRFHPGSCNDSHLLILTSDNVLRLYNIENSVATSVASYAMGKVPMGTIPGSKMFFLSALGDTATDFEFGPPELIKKNRFGTDVSSKGEMPSKALVQSSTKRASETFTIKSPSLKNIQPIELKTDEQKILQKKRNERKRRKNELQWPIFILRGNGEIYLLTILLTEKSKPKLKGPLEAFPSSSIDFGINCCSLLCLHSTAPILCVARSNGTIFHSIVLPTSEKKENNEESSASKRIGEPDRALYTFESIELELGLTTTDDDHGYLCPIFLHPDESSVGRYFASHETGVHAITIPAVDDVVKFLNEPEPDCDDGSTNILKQSSTADYILCTKTSSSVNVNAVIGVALYYDPASIITLLANGQVVTLGAFSLSILPDIENLNMEDTDSHSPLKNMLKEPFDIYIQKILKQASTQPILKLSSTGEHTQQECYELLQRAAQVFRDEHFKHHEKAREEIEKRIKALKMLKQYQLKEVEKITLEKQALQIKAEGLAEKYEDIKDKQEELTNRCKNLLKLILQKKSEPSDAEIQFGGELKEAKDKTKMYVNGVEKLRRQQHYQEKQMENWKKQNKKDSSLGSVQCKSIKSNMELINQNVTAMIKEVNEYKKKLGII